MACVSTLQRHKPCALSSRSHKDCYISLCLSKGTWLVVWCIKLVHQGVIIVPKPTFKRMEDVTGMILLGEGRCGVCQIEFEGGVE